MVIVAGTIDPPAVPEPPLRSGAGGGGLVGAVRDALSRPDPARAGGGMTYFYTLDLLRGIAALAILFWHYRHFMTVSPEPLRPEIDFPLYRQFRLLYDHGGNAVQLFWLLSGFTMASVYVGRQVSTRTFVVHRFARLYPLHLLTLLIVAALQLASTQLVGRTMIYTNNDLAHFVDQLLLTSGWGTTVRLSFNGPVWTVSVELLIYALFWLSLPKLFERGLLWPAILAVGMLLLSRVGPFEPTLQGGFFFFTGCALFPVFRALRDAPIRWVAVALPGLFGLAVLASGRAVGIGSASLMVSLVLGAAFMQVGPSYPGVRRSMKWLGECTYGIYLWHVPLQITVLVTLLCLGASLDLVRTPAFLLVFIASTLGIARLSFAVFEAPWRRTISDRLSSRGNGPVPDGNGGRAATGIQA